MNDKDVHKVIVRNRPEYKSPLLALGAYDKIEEANDTKDEVEQKFGQARLNMHSKNLKKSC